MHDWWVMLFCSLYKNQRYIDQVTLLYRQHANNTIGVTKSLKARSCMEKMKNIANFRRISTALIKQSRVLTIFIRQSRTFYLVLTPIEKKLLSKDALQFAQFLEKKNDSTLSKMFFFLRYKPLVAVGRGGIAIKLILIFRAF